MAQVASDIRPITTKHRPVLLLGDSADSQNVGGSSECHFAFCSNLPDFVERRHHPLFQFGPDFVERKLDDRTVLHPFEVTDGDPTGVRQNVRYNKNTLLMKNLVRFGRGRIIGRFHDVFRLHQWCCFRRQLASQCGGDQQVTFRGEQLFVRKWFPSQEILGLHYLLGQSQTSGGCRSL